MADLPLNELWQWWTELAEREVKLYKQWKPLAEQYARLYQKRVQLERLLRLEEGEPEGGHKIAEAWTRIVGTMPTEQSPFFLSQLAPEKIGLADAAYSALLSAIGRPAHYKQIAEAIKGKGFNIPGKDPEGNLLAHMSNDKKRFAKAPEAGRGFWKLVEWDKEMDRDRVDEETASGSHKTTP